MPTMYTLPCTHQHSLHSQQCHPCCRQFPEAHFSQKSSCFHEVRGVEQALIKFIVAYVKEKYITAMKNIETGKFTGAI